MTVQVVSFHCVLKNKLGHVISTTFNKDVLTHTTQGTLEGLVEGLRDLQRGEKRKISLRADQAYGFYDPDLVVVRSLDQLAMSEPVELGERVLYHHKGTQRMFRVTALSADSMTLDANHPLAGQDLIFEIEALEAREATSEDLEEIDEITPVRRVH